MLIGGCKNKVHHFLGDGLYSIKCSTPCNVRVDICRTGSKVGHMYFVNVASHNKVGESLVCQTFADTLLLDPVQAVGQCFSVAHVPFETDFQASFDVFHLHIQPKQRMDRDYDVFRVCSNFYTQKIAIMSSSISPAKPGLGPTGTQENEFLGSPLDIFRKVPEDHVIEGSRTMFYQPLVPLIDDPDVIDFNVPPSLDYTQLNQVRLEGQFHLTKFVEATDTAAAKWQDAATADNISCIQMLPSTVFRQVSVQLNGVEVADISSYTYAYKSFFETTLSTSREARSTFLKQANMFVMDQPGKADQNTKNTDTGNNSAAKNTQFDVRKDMLVGKPCFSVPLHVDLFSSNLYLVPGVGMRVKLTVGDPNFYFLAPDSNTKYRLRFKELTLSVRHVVVNPKISEKHASMLLTTPANYAFPFGKITTHVIPPNMGSIIVSNISIGEIPQLILCGLVKSSSYNGEITSNPFAFKPYNVSSVYWEINDQTYPTRMFRPDFTTESGALREYLHLVDTLQLNSPYTIPLSYKEFTNNLCLYAIDTSGHQCGGVHKHLTKTGHVNLAFTFSTQNNHPLHLVVYSVYHRSVSINGLREVTLQHTNKS